MASELSEIKNEFDRLFAEHTTESLRNVTLIAADKEIRRLIQYSGEFGYFIMSTFVYRTELEAGVIPLFYSDVYSVDEATEKINKIRFLIWNIEFDVDRTEAIKAVNGLLGDGLISQQALLYLIQNYAFDSKAFLKEFAHE